MGGVLWRAELHCRGAPGPVAVPLLWSPCGARNRARPGTHPLCADSTKGCTGEQLSALEDVNVALG